MNQLGFLQWAANKLSVRHPGYAIGKGGNWRTVRCTRNMYLGVDALNNSEMRVHVFTDREPSVLANAASALPPPPPGLSYSLQRGVDSPDRLYARLTWAHGAVSYAAETARAVSALDWLRTHVLPHIPD